MARPKSDLLSAMGKGFEIIKALWDTITALGGDGDQCLKLIVADKKICQQIAELLAQKATERLLEPQSSVILKNLPEKFVVSEHFKVDASDQAPVKINQLGDNFKQWFLDKTEEGSSDATLQSYKLLKAEVDGLIIAELGGENNVETSLRAIHALMQRQAKGQTGTLLNNGYANIFCVRDNNGVLRTVYVYWYADGWRVYACSVGGPRRWSAGYQVFSSNSGDLDT